MPNANSDETCKVHCNTCHGRTVHRLVSHVVETDRDEEHEYWWRDIYDTLQCCGCREVRLRRRHTFSENEGSEVTFHPPIKARTPPEWQYSLPTEQRKLLREIYAALDSESVRLPMMGARTLIDMLMLDKIGDVGNFQEKLAELEKIGFLSKQNREVLSAALEMGNAASHRGHAPSDNQVKAVMDIVENMLQSAYVFPKVAAELKAAAPARPPRKAPTNKS